MSAKKYLELAKVPTEYAKRMNHLSNRIFGKLFFLKVEKLLYKNQFTLQEKYLFLVIQNP